MLANSSPFKLPVALQRPLGLPLLVLYGTGNWRRFLCTDRGSGGACGNLRALVIRNRRHGHSAHRCLICRIVHSISGSVLSKPH